MLDNNQLEAVEFFQGPCLTLAGPGSGKTTVLVNRIRNLIETRCVAPESILVITFTKDAALEMKNRFINNCNNPKAGLVSFGTFHSIFFSILREEIHLDSRSILQGKCLIEFMKEVIKQNNLDFDDEMIGSLYKEFSFVSNTQADINEYESSAFDVVEFRRLYTHFQEMKKEMNKIDFDDMLILTDELLKDNDRVRRKWQERYKFFLIDEMQDMNDVQFDIIRMLAASRNVFAVGDDDQSIYGFRGANPNIMLDFPKKYEDCKVIRLSRNYRSCIKVVDCASSLISKNEMRFGKSLVANSQEEGFIGTYEFKDVELEAKWVVERIKNKLRQDEKYKCAILFRNKNQSLLVMSLLTREGVGYFVKEKMNNIYEHWIFQDVMSYLKLAVGKGVRADYLRIYNKPNRYINRASLDKENVQFTDIKSFYKDKPYMLPRIREMEADVKRIRSLRPSSAILYLRKKIGYDQYIRESTGGNRKQYEDYMKVLDDILLLSREYRDVNTFVRDSVDRADMSKDNNNHECDNHVFLYTFHASKGLEFDNVYILDVNEGVTPSKKAENQKALEEERRMFYVAVTRAKTNLYLCHVRQRNNEKLFPSRFLGEMLDEY